MLKINPDAVTRLDSDTPNRRQSHTGDQNVN